MPRNYKMHVWEVQQAAQAILQFTDGKTLHDYVTEPILRSAVERQINKIGGALASLIVNDNPTAQRIGGYGGTLGWGQNLEPQLVRIKRWKSGTSFKTICPNCSKETTAALEQESDDQPVSTKSQPRKIIPLVASRTPQIRNLCRRHHVKRLDVFGSAVNGDFHPDESDIDFLVQFDDSPEAQRFETRFQLTEELKALFGRSVDLVDDSAIQNPYFRDEVDQTREPIYET